ncbi:hypothetical protein JXA88_00015, partial [Candidatus Fermentibacteria bacterium]|nr:hypothetical protein [Candidatus Fermentibacteria bacterium]
MLSADLFPALIDGNRIEMDPDESHPWFLTGCPFERISSQSIPGAPEGGVYVVFGKADVIAAPMDYFGNPPYSSMAELGVYGIGYSIHDGMSEGADLVAGGLDHERCFDSSLSSDQAEDSDLTQTIFRNTQIFNSENDTSLYYAVTNYHPGLQNWNVQASLGCWNTILSSQGDPNVPWEGPSATTPDNARFKDGVYRVEVRARDVQQEVPTDASIPVIVDNFAPFLRKTMVCRPRSRREGRVAEETPHARKDSRAGTPEERDWNAMYQAEWELGEGTELELQVIHREPAAVDEE